MRPSRLFVEGQHLEHRDERLPCLAAMSIWIGVLEAPVRQLRNRDD